MGGGVTAAIAKYDSVVRADVIQKTFNLDEVTDLADQQLCACTALHYLHQPKVLPALSKLRCWSGKGLTQVG